MFIHHNWPSGTLLVHIRTTYYQKLCFIFLKSFQAVFFYFCYIYFCFMVEQTMITLFTVESFSVRGSSFNSTHFCALLIDFINLTVQMRVKFNIYFFSSFKWGIFFFVNLLNLLKGKKITRCDFMQGLGSTSKKK